MRVLFTFSLLLLASKATSFHHLDEEEALFDKLMKTGNMQLFTDFILNGTFHQLVRPTIQLSEAIPSKQSQKTRTQIKLGTSDRKGSNKSIANLILRNDETTTTTATSPTTSASTTTSSPTTTQAATTPPSTTTTTAATNTEQQTTKKSSSSCCTSVGCYDPCPYQMMPMPMQMSYQVQQPVVFPMQMVYEPVVHDHPPLHEIKRIIKKDKRKRRQKHYTSDSEDTDTRNSCSSTETDSDSDGEGESDTDIDYYGDFMHVKG